MIARRLHPSPDFLRLLLFTNAAIPALLLGWDTLRGQLGSNPQEYLIRTTGMLTLIFLTGTLTVTPLLRLTGIGALINLRRMAGLFTFFYGCLHALSYSWFDKDLDPGRIISDVWQRPFIFLGMFAFLSMIPLALTSTRASIRRLGGGSWKRLHRLIYPAAGAAVIHYYLLVRADKQLPIVFGLLIAGLLIWRVVRRRKA